MIGTMMEVYSCLQQRLRARFEGHPVIWMNLINGSFAYLPPASLYDGLERYQVWQTPCGRGSLEALENAAAGILEELLRA